MKKLLFTILFCFLSSPLLSAPAITGVSGTLTNGTAITISGSGFGTKTAAPKISSYDNATSANNFHGGSIGGSWATGGNTTIQTSGPRASTYQSDRYAQASYNYATYGYSTLNWNDSSSSTTDYYYSIWFKVTASTFNTSPSGGNSKTVRWYPNSGGASSVQTTYAQDNQDGGQATTYMTSDDGMTGSNASILYMSLSEIPYTQWYHQEGWVHGGWSSGDLMHYRIWLNGKYQGDFTDKYFNSTHNANWWRFGDVSGYNQSGGYILIDQVYIDSTPAHIFLSNRSNITTWAGYNSTAHNEIQVPSAWSASSITVTLNIGTFGASDTAYLYVVDSSGAISPSHQVTLGGGEEPPPSVPTITGVTISGGSL
jgi:hypothetical protein